MSQTHDFTATLQFGMVSAVDEAGHNLRVKIPALEDMETDWLPMSTPAPAVISFTACPTKVSKLSACWTLAAKTAV